jgi:hypothetical protein
LCEAWHKFFMMMIKCHGGLKMIKLCHIVILVD